MNISISNNYYMTKKRLFPVKNKMSKNIGLIKRCSGYPFNSATAFCVNARRLAAGHPSVEHLRQVKRGKNMNNVDV